MVLILHKYDQLVISVSPRDWNSSVNVGMSAHFAFHGGNKDTEKNFASNRGEIDRFV